jgi:cytochrome c oxidase subunit 2
MCRRAKSGRPSQLALFLAALVAAVAIALLLAGVAWADAVTPEAGPTQNAIKTDTLYKIVLVLGLGVLALVWGVLFYSLVRFRARRGRVAPQIRGNTPLEMGWTIGAVTLVTVIAVISLLMLGDIRDPTRSGPAALAEAQNENAATGQPPVPGDKALDIKVSGQQYIWRYQYPNGAVSFQQMVVPKDTTVTLQIKSNDVAHSWWIPALGGKQDAIPGLTNQTWFKATRTGTFRGQCAELCGANHAFMTAKVVVVEPAEYLRWVDDQKKLIQQSQKQVLKLKKQFQGQPAAAAGS